MAHLFYERYHHLSGNVEFLLQALCGALAGRGEAVDWRQLTEADWDVLVRIAEAELVSPLLYRALCAGGSGDWTPPAQPAEALRSGYYENVKRNMLLFYELERVLAALGARGIPVVLLKGAALAKSLYEDIGLRVMGDLDVLVPKERVNEAIEAAEGFGYCTEPQWRYPELRAGQRMLTFFEANLDGGPNGQTHLELHWGLVAAEVSIHKPRMEWFWQNTRPDERANVYQLNSTANVLFLCAHLALKHILYKHGGDHTLLRWYYDLHLLITQRGDEVDWEEVLRRGQEFHWVYGLQEALRRTIALFGTHVPAGFLGQLENLEDSRAERLRRRSMRPVKTRSSQGLDDYALIDGRAKLWLAAGLIFPSRTYIVQRYHPRPEGLWPLWYPYRWFVISFDLLKTLYLSLAPVRR